MNSYFNVNFFQKENAGKVLVMEIKMIQITSIRWEGENSPQPTRCSSYIT
jgi:hypothetical protein